MIPVFSEVLTSWQIFRISENKSKSLKRLFLYKRRLGDSRGESHFLYLVKPFGSLSISLQTDLCSREARAGSLMAAEVNQSERKPLCLFPLITFHLWSNSEPILTKQIRAQRGELCWWTDRLLQTDRRAVRGKLPAHPCCHQTQQRMENIHVDWISLS